MYHKPDHLIIVIIHYVILIIIIIFQHHIPVQEMQVGQHKDIFFVEKDCNFFIYINYESKNKRDKKNKKGGKIGDDIHNRRIGSIVVTLTAAEMTSKIEEHVFISGNIEVCGVYVLVSDGSSLTSPIDYHGESIRRPLCTTPEKTLYAIIWHTHPYSSKFYPSIQDIMTIKKKRKNGERIQISIIYTSL